MAGARMSGLGLLAALGAFAMVAMAALAAPAAPPLAADDQAAVKRVESYLNAITTLAGRFLQTSSNGGEATGRFYLWRPGRLRFDYDPPVPDLIIATGDLLIHYDRELKTASQIFQESTPAAFLLQKEIRFERDFQITHVGLRPGVISLTFVQAKEPATGSVTLILGDSPLALREWIVTDQQGVETRVSLLDYQQGGRLDGKLFEFNEPTWLDEERKRKN
jgi:outer membrane lipoprotein-sorting protein